MSIRTNLKKFLVIAVLALITIVIVGCKKKVEEVENLAIKQAEKVHLPDIDNIVADFPLPKFVQGNKEVKITWVSDNQEIVKIGEQPADETEETKELYYLADVTLPAKKTTVTLTATITMGEHVATKKIELIVQADAYADMTAVGAKTAALDLLAKVDGSVMFVSDSGYAIKDETGFVYVYGSNHGRKIGEKVIVRGKTAIYNFMPQLSSAVAEKVGNEPTGYDPATLATESSLGSIMAHDKTDKAFFTTLLKISGVVRKTTNANVPFEIVNPYKLGEFVGVSKYTSAKSIEVLEAHKDKYIEANVIVYDNRDAKFNVLFPDVNPKVLADVVYTDQNKADLALESLQIDLNETIVTGNMDLKTVVEKYGATVVWTSGSPLVIDNTGKVTFPDSDAKVTLTIATTVGEATATGTIEVTVKKILPTKVNEILNQTPAKATDEKPFIAVVGKVIGHQYNGYWVADETGAVLIWTKDAVNTETPAIGAFVEVTGYLTTFGEGYQFTSQISPVGVKVLTEGTAPEPIGAVANSIDDLFAMDVNSRESAFDAAKELYGKLITITGEVRGSGNYWYIDGTTEGQFFRLNNLKTNEGLVEGQVVNITVMVRDFYFTEDASGYNNYKTGTFGGIFFAGEGIINPVQ